MVNKAICLSFILNVIVLWNIEKMQKTFQILKSKGYHLQEDMTLSFKILEYIINILF